MGQSPTSSAPVPRPLFFPQHHFRLCWKILLPCDAEALPYRKMFRSSKLMIPWRWTHFKDACLLSHSPALLCFANFCLVLGWAGKPRRFLPPCWHCVLLFKQSGELIPSDHRLNFSGKTDHVDSECCFNAREPHREPWVRTNTSVCLRLNR